MGQFFLGLIIFSNKWKCFKIISQIKRRKCLNLSVSKTCELKSSYSKLNFHTFIKSMNVTSLVQCVANKPLVLALIIVTRENLKQETSHLVYPRFDKEQSLPSRYIFSTVEHFSFPFPGHSNLIRPDWETALCHLQKDSVQYPLL